MKNFFICLFISTATFLIGLNFYSHSAKGIAKTEALGLVNKFHDSLINKNEATLKQIVSDNVQMFHNNQSSSGTKEQVLLNFKELDVKSINTYFVFTNVIDEKVKVSFWMEMKFYNDDESLNGHYGHYAYTFEKQNNTWKLTKIHLEN